MIGNSGSENPGFTRATQSQQQRYGPHARVKLQKTFYILFPLLFFFTSSSACFFGFWASQPGGLRTSVLFRGERQSGPP